LPETSCWAALILDVGGYGQRRCVDIFVADKLVLKVYVYRNAVKPRLAGKWGEEEN
jgi:hypothetical protein